MREPPAPLTDQLRGAVGLLFGAFLLAYAATGWLFPHPVGAAIPADRDLPFFFIAAVLLLIGVMLAMPWAWAAALHQEPPVWAQFALIGLAAFAALFGMALALAVTSPPLVILAAGGGVVLTAFGARTRIRSR